MAKFWLLAAGISGFLSVALGAFGAHTLKNVLDDYGRSIYEKAVLYQMFHTVALFAVGLLQHFQKETSFSAAGWGFVVGILLFSGSLYLMAVTGVKWLGIITPIGGAAFLFGWLCLLWAIAKGRFRFSPIIVPKGRPMLSYGRNIEREVEREKKGERHPPTLSHIVCSSQRRRPNMTTPRHCPGFEQFKGLKSFICKCPNCGKEAEIFSDEFDKRHTCKGCRQEIDFTKCTLTGGATDTSPR